MEQFSQHRRKIRCSTRFGNAGNGTFEPLDGYTMASTIPQTNSYNWSDAPFNEAGTTTPGGGTTGNGGELRMGNAATADGIELVKTDILDNFAQRAGKSRP